MQRERVRGQYALVISLTWYYDAFETPHGGLEVRHLIYLSCYTLCYCPSLCHVLT